MKEVGHLRPIRTTLLIIAILLIVPAAYAADCEAQAVFLHNMGVIYYQCGHMEKAEKLFEKAIGLNPEYGKAYYSLGLLVYEQDRFEDAVDAFREAATLLPDDPNVQFDLGIALVDVYRNVDEDPALLEEALEQYNIAADLGQEHAKENAEIVEKVLKSLA